MRRRLTGIALLAVPLACVGVAWLPAGRSDNTPATAMSTRAARAGAPTQSTAAIKAGWTGAYFVT